jgi:hypothetical protein
VDWIRSVFSGLAVGFSEDWIGFFRIGCRFFGGLDWVFPDWFFGFQRDRIADGSVGSMVVKRVRIVDNTKIVKVSGTEESFRQSG